MSKRESIPLWNGTDKRDDDKSIGGDHGQGDKISVEKSVSIDRKQRKISAYLTSKSNKRGATTDCEESVGTASKRVAREEADMVDENDNIQGRGPKDHAGITDEVNFVLESDTYGSGEEEDGAEQNVLFVAKKPDVDSKERTEDEGKGHSDDDGSGEEEDSVEQNVLFVAKKPDVDSKERTEDEGKGHSDDENEVAKLRAVHGDEESHPILQKTGDRPEKVGKPQSSSQPQKKRPKRVLRSKEELYGGLISVVESDYEVKGDDPQWTDDRRQNRILRYGERLKLQAGATALAGDASTESDKAALAKVVLLLYCPMFS